MIKAAIIGAAGLSGLELIRILNSHPGVELSVVTSGKYRGQPVARTFPQLRTVSLEFQDHDCPLADTQVVFLAVPNKASLDAVPGLLAQGRKVIDLSGVFRLHDTEVFRKAYRLEMTAPEALAEAVFGLPEAFGKEIAGARLIANPGCYPTAALLGLLPLGELAGELAAPPVIDAKSGVSGAGGRVEDDSVNFMEVNENFKAYKVFRHQHTPEIQEYLEQLTPFRADTCGPVVFTPHLLPLARGILSTMYVRFTRAVAAQDIRARFENYASGRPFVTLLPAGADAELKMAVGTNSCVISLHPDESGKNLVIVSAIDNLLKGASGQAVQNMNLMFGLDEALGLD
ncbi:MAG: N-acetyl-gamma-glutamyl-phosphate reductase [Deltaproteobacteria bacterium]|nr:N-acetyl-gamma-glutamyl-phosphate reductase [Deltaproteobacteria bacterium]